METERRWFRGTTLAFMIILLLPTLSENAHIISSAVAAKAQLPAVVNIMIVVLLISQIGLAYYVALTCDWIVDAGGTRHFLQFSLKTYLVLLLIMSLLVGLYIDRGLYEYGFPSQAISTALSTAFIPVFFVFVFMMVAAAAHAVNSHVCDPWGGKPNIVPAQIPIAQIPDDLRTKVIGSIPLYVLFAVCGVSAWTLENIRVTWQVLRIDTPLPSNLALWFSGTFTTHLWIPILIIVLLHFVYWSWVCKDRRRIFWFNFIIIGLTILGLVAVSLSVVLPFFKFSSCILRGTRVKTPSGQQPIENLKPGEEVLSRSASGEIAVSTVTDIRSAEVEEHLVLVLDGGIELSCTGEHPIAVGNQWIRAKLLHVGDEVVCHDRIRKLVEIRTVKERVVVYDITVEPHHNFFAAGVLVHNKIGKK